MKIGRYLLAALIIFGFAGIAYASPVGLTSEADATEAELLWADDNVGLGIGFIADIVDERKIDVARGKYEMSVYAGRIGLSIGDRLYLYADLGTATDMEYFCEVNATTSEVTYEYDDEFIWGIGANALLYRWNNGLEIGMGANYRQVDMAIDKATIDSVSYTRTQLDSVRDGEYNEWQVALELAWKTDYFIPYVGMKYSDVEVDGDVTLTGVQYNASGKNASENVGAFVGLTITPKLTAFPGSERISLNLECRFLDEDAINAGVTYKF